MNSLVMVFFVQSVAIKCTSHIMLLEDDEPVQILRPENERR